MLLSPAMSHPKNTDFIDQLNAQMDADAESEAHEVSKIASEAGAGKSDDFAKLLEESLKRPTRKLSVGDKIRGQILVLGNEDVYVSTGGQHDGVIARRDLNNEDGTCPHKAGDTIELYVTQVRGSEIRLS